MKKKILIVVALVVVALIAWKFIAGGKPELHYVSEFGKAQMGNITNSVTATGSIEPVTSVEVGTQVSGIVSKIYVDYNSVVKKGQVIAELDKTNLLSELSTAQSNCTSQKSNLEYQEHNYNRYKTMFEKGLISENDYENAHLTYIQAQTSYQSAVNSLAKAQTNLGYATITSPIDGVVLSKAVEEGQTVAASFSTPTLFNIAQDLTDMRVIADIDEADIGEVREGQRVSFTVDAYPNDVFEGSVTQVRQEATTTSNVVTYEVVIAAPNKELKLKPGLTASVTIYTLEKNNVLTIPAKALRFTPTEMMLQNGGQIIDCEGMTKVWQQQGNNFVAKAIKTGISNGALCEVTDGLADGESVVVSCEANMGFQFGGMPQGGGNPFMPGPPNSRRR
ncbi:MAG: efflux RND transporter periplasmic adaptor subunit [Bacteroidales bacterium]|nr:efflux RND transporter periplasmic adaptor subunit [Bacteroidales bacterium]